MMVVQDELWPLTHCDEITFYILLDYICFTLLLIYKIRLFFLRFFYLLFRGHKWFQQVWTQTAGLCLCLCLCEMSGIAIRRVPVCLPAGVPPQQNDVPDRTSVKLPHVIVAICGVHGPSCCARKGTQCPVSVTAAVYEPRENNRAGAEWLCSLVHHFYTRLMLWRGGIRCRSNIQHV